MWQIRYTDQGHLPTKTISDIDFTDEPNFSSISQF